MGEVETLLRHLAVPVLTLAGRMRVGTPWILLRRCPEAVTEGSPSRDRGLLGDPWPPDVYQERIPDPDLVVGCER